MRLSSSAPRSHQIHSLPCFDRPTLTPQVGLEDVEEKILALEDQVQSLDLLNMNKVSGR